MSNQVPVMQTANALHIQATNPHTVQIEATGPQMVQIPLTNVPMMQIQSPTAVKKRFSARNKLFKTAIGCLLLCAVVFIVGFSAPAWNRSVGLWMTCEVWEGECITLNTIDLAWFNAVRAMECLALVAFVFCLAVEFYQDFRKFVPLPAENKAVEILAFLAGLFGLIGVTVYGVEIQTGIIYVGYGNYIHSYLNWGFGLVAGACSLSIVCAACIAYSRVKHAAQTNAALASQSYAVPQPLTFQHPGIATGDATMAMYTQPSPAGYYYVAGNQNVQSYLVGMNQGVLYPAMASSKQANQ